MSSLPIGVVHVTVVAGPPVEVQVRVNSTGSSDDVRVNTGSSDITGVPAEDMMRVCIR